MFQRLEELLYARLSQHTFPDEDALYLHILMLAANTFCILVHLFLLAAHFFAGFHLLGIICTAELALYAVTFRVIQRRHYVAAGTIITLTVCMYTAFSSYYLGIETYAPVLYFLALIMQAIIPYASGKYRFFMGLFVWICVLSSCVLAIFFPPVQALDTATKFVFIFIHGNLVAVGATVEALIGTSIRQLIRRFDGSRIEKYRQLANTDTLTGLSNRRHADHYVQAIAAEIPRRAFCAAMVDIDDFKNVNDAFGHNIGDIVLKALADTMVGSLRKNDMVFRWGGEEFFIILAHVDLPTAYAICEKLRMRIAATPIPTPAGDIYITVTIGVAALDLDHVTQSIERSDKKLYEGKRGNKNVVMI